LDYGPVVVLGMAILDEGGLAHIRLLCLSAVLFAIYFVSKRSPPLPLTAAIWFVCIHTIWLSAAPYESFLTVIGWLPGFLIVAVMWGDEKPRAEPNALKQSAVIVDILAVIAILSTGPGILGIWATGSWATTPLVGTFYWHNQMAIFLVMVLLPFGVRLMMVQPRARVSYLLVAGYLVAVFLLARSVGALLALLLALLYFGVRIWSADAKRSLWIPLVPIALIVILLPFRTLYGPYITRIVNIVGGGHSVEARLDYWAAAWTIFTKHTVFGTGLGTFEFLYPQYQKTLASYSNDPHNLLMQLLAETGIIGAVIVFGFLIWLGWRMFRATPAAGAAPLAMALEAAFVAGIVHSLMDFDWGFPAFVMTLFLIAGLRIRLPRAEETTAPEMPVSRKRRSRSGRLGRMGRRRVSVREPAFVVAAGGLLLFWLLESPGFSRLRAYSQKPDMMGTAEGRVYLENALRLFPWNAPVNYTIGRDAVETNPSEGARFAERALKLNPLHPDYHLLAAAYAIREGNDEEMEKRARTALSLDPWNRPYIYLEIGWLEVEMGNTDEAQETLERAVKRYPYRTAEEVFSARLEFRGMRANITLADIHRLLADIYDLSGETQKANEHREWASALVEAK
jgi:O-antigen ligase